MIAIFTKFDGLVTMTYNELRKKQSIKEAKNKKVEIAESTLKTDFIDPLMAMTLTRWLDSLRHAVRHVSEDRTGLRVS